MRTYYCSIPVHHSICCKLVSESVGKIVLHLKIREKKIHGMLQQNWQDSIILCG